MTSLFLELYDIPEYEDKYCATKDGRIYSLISKRFLTKSDDTYNYDTVNLSGKTTKVHKLMGKTFLQNPENHIQIDHIDRNRKNNHIENLRYVSASENMKNRTLKPRNSELRHINVKKSTFKVTITDKNKNRIFRSFKTLDEAKEFRDAIILSKKSSQA